MSSRMVERCLLRCLFVRLRIVGIENIVLSIEEHFCTLTYQRRPYGVGLLIAGVDV